MGRYSRKDMIEFANYAKSFQSPQKVIDAYKAYLEGGRIITRSNSKLYDLFKQSNIVYLNGLRIKNKFGVEDVKLGVSKLRFYEILHWDNDRKILTIELKKT